jgi:hypothetical protein
VNSHSHSHSESEVVVGIVLILRFAHNFGLIYGHLNINHIFLMLIIKLKSQTFLGNGQEIYEDAKDAGVLSRERWSPSLDVREFISILFGMISDRRMMLFGVVTDQPIDQSDIPVFVSDLIAARRSTEPRIDQSFNDIFGILKNNDLQIVSGVDSADVLTFIGWVKSFE